MRGACVCVCELLSIHAGVDDGTRRTTRLVFAVDGCGHEVHEGGAWGRRDLVAHEVAVQVLREPVDVLGCHAVQQRRLAHTVLTCTWASARQADSQSVEAFETHTIHDDGKDID
jgi:hypothetical protein